MIFVFILIRGKITIYFWNYTHFYKEIYVTVLFLHLLWVPLCVILPFFNVQIAKRGIVMFNLLGFVFWS